tara:strand:+ start:41607 stop:41921 length:315 start_codon:yes stop_codon:yes gene_type:complete
MIEGLSHIDIGISTASRRNGDPMKHVYTLQVLSNKKTGLSLIRYYQNGQVHHDDTSPAMLTWHPRWGYTHAEYFKDGQIIRSVHNIEYRTHLMDTIHRALIGSP